ncbi:alanine racemase domain protein [Xylogone sp. PMI_703]|nr:alanine racemase domain protein [Xylogone sp. PMI_703]
MSSFYTISPKEELSSAYVGKSIHNVPTPAAIIDLAVVKRNCQRMLDACESLQLEWRAHVKTHKTVELTQLQVGSSPSRPVNLIISTIAEAELLLPLLKSYRAQSRPVNILYGLPISPGQIPRLASIAKELGPRSISVLLDHPSQISHLQSFVDLSNGVAPLAHVKIDMGGSRAGVIPGSESFNAVIDAALKAHEKGTIILSGLYSHAGHSYGGDSPAAAMTMLQAELLALQAAAESIISTSHSATLPPLTLSVGASPTALSIQNLLNDDNNESTSNGNSSKTNGTTATSSLAKPDDSSKAHFASLSLRTLLKTLKSSNLIVEIHAGVYPTLDLQQLAAHSISTSRLSWSDIAFTIVAEVVSNYPGRGTNGYPEALIGAGGLALGREPCKAYPGMAMLTPWNRPGVKIPERELPVEAHNGWIVGRFAQEHGIVTWMGEAEGKQPDELVVGQKVKLWPNHACIAGSHFGWYFVVDTERSGKEDEIVDIWVKARGW